MTKFCPHFEVLKGLEELTRNHEFVFKSRDMKFCRHVIGNLTIYRVRLVGLVIEAELSPVRTKTRIYV